MFDRRRWMECDDSDSEDSDSEEASESVQNEKILALEKENKVLQERVKMLEDMILKMLFIFQMVTNVSRVKRFGHGMTINGIFLHFFTQEVDHIYKKK